MAPKKGKKKQQDDDWEAELGETVTTENDALAQEAQAAEEAGAGEEVGGGLMAALQRRGKKKNKKGANTEVEGEDPPAADGGDAFADKAPQEASFEDDDDVFAGNYGKKNKKGAAAPEKEEPAPETPPAEAPRMKTKAEKEKEKKEKEKQRKKELVRQLKSQLVHRD